MITTIKTLIDHRELIANFTTREVKTKYKEASLGILWAVLEPLIFILVMTVVFSIVARVPTGDIPYPLFLMTALLPWLFTAGCIGRGTSALVNQAGLITKIYFPRESLVIASLLAALFDFAIVALLYVLLLIYYGVAPNIHWLMAIPIFFIQLLMGVGFMLWLAPLNMLYRDVGHLMPRIVQILMFASPIMYPVSLIPEKYQDYYFLNPIACLLNAYRDVILLNKSPDLWHLSYALMFTLALVYFGYRYFKKVEMRLADI